METYTNLYPILCSHGNLELAWKKARKRKTTKDYVLEFESDLENNLKQLQHELETFAYLPAPLTVFIVRDPKTRKISASHFRDRVVHHALCNIIEPILSKSFIYDSFANQKGKGAHKAIRRFEYFMRKVVGKCILPEVTGGQRKLFVQAATAGYVLKADIRHYFDTVDQDILLSIIERKIKDPNVVWLIKTILCNHKTGIPGKGMPIGNLTSQFFANVYLNELDRFVKRELKAKYYIRYVDDFVILDNDKNVLIGVQAKIVNFLRLNLNVELHPEKTRIEKIGNGITFLGFRIFPNHRLLKKSNSRRIWKRLDKFKERYGHKELRREQVKLSLEGWLAYAGFADTYKFRKKILKRYYQLFYAKQQV